MKRFVLCIAMFAVLCGAAFGAPVKAMILDGQNNHDWKATTPILNRELLKTRRFEVDVVTSPREGQSQAEFNPDFAKYDVVILNYNGDMWNPHTRAAFIDYVSGGGGVVVVHAADNAFGDWKEYNEIIGLGGWGGRTKKSGPYVYLKDGELVRDYESDGPSGAHEGFARIIVDTQLPEHPIMQGMPAQWYQDDELYNYMRGPGKNMTVLATAYSGKPEDQGGSGRDEPMLFTVTYGGGRVFHTMLGHDARSVRDEGFALTFTRGAEWAATGEVTIPVTEDIPRPLAPHEALGDLDEDASYHPAHEVITEIAGLAGQPEALAQVEATLIGYLEDPETPFLALQATCNALGIMGSKAAVPALAKLLRKDAPRASAARLALERIEGAEATAALLDALQEGQDFDRDGVINSLGRRRDASAVPTLTSLAQSGNAAAIGALGKIGNADSLAALQALPASANVTTALLVCADRLLAEGQAEATKPVFNALLQQDGLAVHHLTAALRGMLIVDSEAGMAHVWSMLEDAHRSTVALNVLGSVPGTTELAEDLLAHFDGLPAGTQIALTAILGGMRQPEARPRMLELAKATEDTPLKEAAIAALGQIPGNEASVSFLCAEATSKDSAFRRLAHQSLVGTPGNEAEGVIIDGILSGATEARLEYMKAAQDRSLEAACPALLKAAEDSEPAVRKEAFDSLRTLAGTDEYEALIALVVSAPEDAQSAAVRAVQYTGRKVNEPADRLAPLVDAMEKGGDSVGVALLPVLADISSEEALATVTNYAKSGSTQIQSAAIETLGDWKDPAAIDATLELASATDNLEQQGTLMDAFARLIAKSENVPADKKLAQCRQALDIGLDTRGKEALLKAVSEIIDGRALELIEEVGQDPELEEAAHRASATIKQALLGDPVLSASHNTDELSNAIDGDPNTRWSSNGSMKPGMWFGIDLRMQSNIYAVTLDTTKSQNDYPRGYKVYVGAEEIDTDAAEPVASGEGTGPITKIEFDPPIKGRYIKIVQTGKEGLFWSIHELTVSHDPGFDSIPPPEVAVEDLLGGNGFITNWNVAGPFTQAGKDGNALFNTVFGPEMDAAMAVWQPLNAEVVSGGIVDLEKLFGGDNRVAYLVANIVSEEPAQVTLSMGSDDGIKAWLNGELVHEQMAIRPLGPDTDKVAVNLIKGENILLLKVVDVAGQWGACARMVSE